jgi:hypothetical protein
MIDSNFLPMSARTSELYASPPDRELLVWLWPLRQPPHLSAQRPAMALGERAMSRRDGARGR